MKNLKYKKGIVFSRDPGQLYETKLLSLILFRALHDDDIEDFYLGTNVDGLGVFDDICFRFRLKGCHKPIAIFLQAKHRVDQNRLLTVTKTDLMNYFSSYLKISNKFNVNSSDVFFRGAYDDFECVFVLYSNTRVKLNKHYNGSSYIRKINDTLSTGEKAFQLTFTEDDVEQINKMKWCDNIGKLATLIANIVRHNGENYTTLMNDELIQTYHVLLAKQVFIIHDAHNTNYQLGSFNKNFFNTTIEHLQLLRDRLVNEIISDKNPSDKETFVSMSLLYLSNTLKLSINTINTLMDSINTNSNKNDEIVDNKKCDNTHLREQLDKVNNTQPVVEQASAIARTVLLSKSFKLPAAFGNRDLTLRGSDEKIKKRLLYLAYKMVHLLQESNIIEVDDETYNIIYIDDDFPDKGFLQINGGIGGAVGNLLILDEKTHLLMFENGNSLNGHAKTLFEDINSRTEELEKYRFDVNVKNFPKLSLDCNEHEKSIVADFTNKFFFFGNQARESEVEHILKGEIAQLRNTRDRLHIKSDAIFLAYHDSIQKWWMQPKYAEYLTKTCGFFQDANERFLSNALQINNDIKFDTKFVNLLNLDESISKMTIIVSDVIALSVIKVIQNMNNDDYILLSLNYILSHPFWDRDYLNRDWIHEKDKIFILTYRLSEVSINEERYNRSRNRNEILQTLQEHFKKLIVVTTNESAVPVIKKYIAIECFLIFDNQNSIVDLTKESQENIISKTKVIFQGVQVSLSLLIDDYSRVFIKGQPLDQIMNGEIIQIGQPLTNSRYEEIKDIYVSRRVTTKRVFLNRQDDENEPVGTMAATLNLETFYDIDDHAVLITADPGMGKSTLLTHLSLTTKTRNPDVWIVRINLLDYSGFFYQWKENKMVLDITEALRFVCIALFNPAENDKIILNEKNGEIFLKDCYPKVDEGIIFEINMFLHSCNRYKVIFVFDGFDEISPHYETQVVQFLKVLKHYRPRGNRIWITSRGYHNTLDQVISDYHQLQPFNSGEQQVFIERFLNLKLVLNELNPVQMEKVNDFMSFMAHFQRSWIEDEDCMVLYKYRSLPLRSVYLDAAEYLKKEIQRVPFHKNKKKYLKAWDLKVLLMKVVLIKCKDDLLQYITRNSIAPLQIYMAAEYLQNEIKHVKTDTIWDLTFHTNALYEHFVEKTLTKICSEEKNQSTLEIARKEFINEHKKLAAYAMFFKDVHRLFSETELEEIRNAVNTINSGREKTGVFYTVIDGVPRFVHLSFAEYFAVEHICDLLKAERTDDDLKSLWDFILNTVFNKSNEGVLNVLDDKLIMDKELKSIVNDARSRRIIFDLLMEQSAGDTEHYVDQYRDDVYKESKINSPLQIAMTENLRNLTSLLLSTYEYITKDRIDDLITIILKAEAFLHYKILKNIDFINVVLEIVRKIDPSKLAVLYDKIPKCPTCKQEKVGMNESGLLYRNCAAGSDKNVE